jgi:solute carrier family 35 protein E3
MAASFVTIGWILGSIASSTSIIMMNKYVMDNYNFSSPTFLTSYHFLVTWGALELMCRMNLFEPAKTFPPLQRWILGSSTVCGVVSMNFNLKMNSVGFYQLSKLMCIPTIVAYNLIFEHKTTPIPTLISLAVLLVGISLFTVNDVQVNLAGTLVAIFAVICSAFSQTKTGSVQKQYGIGGPSAQHATALNQFCVGILSALAIETWGPNSILTHSFEKIETVVILLTGLVSISTNVCTFGLIGKTSAVTYQVVGHCKTILIFVFGLIMFPARQSETTAQFVKKIAGLVISMTGVAYYTYLELKAKAAAGAIQPAEDKKGDTQQLLPVRGELGPEASQPPEPHVS